MAGYLFDYEKKVWGGDLIRLSPIHFRALRLFYLLKALKDVKGKVLDAGCGAGDFVEALNFYRPDLELYGIDISNKAIKIAKERVKIAKFIVGSVEKLPFKNNSFDAVLSFDVIEHVEFPQKALAEAYRVLKPKGVFHGFIPTEANIDTLEGLILKFGWKAKEIYGAHPQHYTTLQVKTIFEKNKFKIVDLKWADHLFQQLVEIGYFSFLALRGKNLEYTVEGYISTSKPNFFINSLRLLRNILAIISNTESRIFYWLSGLGIHITARKDK